MRSEPEPTRSAATAWFGRKELQRTTSPIPGWESVQSAQRILYERPRVLTWNLHEAY